MNHQTEVDILTRLLAHLEMGTTASADRVRGAEISVYSSADLLTQEKLVMFSGYPLVAGLSADLPSPGAFLTQQLLGTPVLVVRGADGRVRAFVNVCRHRGAMVENALCGVRKLFTCPFHGWSFDAEGRLVGMPHRETFGDIEKSTLNLTPLPVQEKYGIIWLKLAPNGNSFEIDDQLAGLGEELEGLGLNSAALVGRDHLANKMNWKFAIDTFGETYHFAVLHKDSVNKSFHSNVQLYDIYGRNHRMVFAGRGIEKLREKPESDWSLRPNSLLAYYLFPNTQLLIQRGGISLFRIFPDGDDPQKCVTEFSFYAERSPRTPEEDVLAKYFFERTRNVIRDEDYAMGEAAQRSLASGAHKYAVFGRNEPALHHYHSTYRAALGMQPLVSF